MGFVCVFVLWDCLLDYLTALRLVLLNACNSIFHFLILFFWYYLVVEWFRVYIGRVLEF